MKPRTTISIVLCAQHRAIISRFCQVLLDLPLQLLLLPISPSGPFSLQSSHTCHTYAPYLFSVPKRNFLYQIARASRRFDFSNSLYFRLSTTLLGAPGWTAAVKPKKFSKRLGWPLRMALHRSTHDSSCSSPLLPVFFFSSAKAPTPPPTPPLRTLQTFHKH